MKIKLLVSSLVGSILFTSVLHAENTSVGANIGLFGIGANAKYKINEQMGVRVGFDMFKVSDIDIEDEEVKYVFDAKVQDITLLADWHPWKGSFRTSAGLLINSSELDGDIIPTDKIGETIEFDFNEKHYEYKTDELGSINTTADFDPVAPYIGIGWDTSFNKDKGFGFTFDLGIAFQGSMNTDYSLNFGDALDVDKETAGMADGPAKEAVITNINAKRKEIKDELEKELDKEMKTLQDELDKYEIMPYIAIGFNYKF